MVFFLELVHLQPELVALVSCQLLLVEVELVKFVRLVLTLRQLLLEHLAVRARSELALVSLKLKLLLEFLILSIEFNDLRSYF